MKTFVANGPIAIDVEKFQLSIERIIAGTSKSLVIKEILGSFSVPYEKCKNSTIACDEDLCIVSRNRIITGIKIQYNDSDKDYSHYSFTATDIQPYGS